MKILDYLTKNTRRELGYFAIHDPKAEVFPLRQDCRIVVVENSKFPHLSHLDGFSMLIVSESYYSFKANTVNVMVSDNKEDLIKAYAYLLSEGIVSTSTSGSLPISETKKALEEYKKASQKDIESFVSWSNDKPIMFSEKTIDENTDESRLPEIDDEYYNE